MASSFTFTIAPDTGTTLVFSHVAPGSGNFALSCQIDPPVRDIFRFHAAGVKGNITVRDEARGMPIRLRALIVNTLPLAWAKVVTLFSDCRAYPAIITDAGGIAWSKCNMVDGKILDIKADGTGTDLDYVELTFEITFTKDQDF